MKPRTVSWALLVVVLLTALAVGRTDGSDETPAERVRRLGGEFACPTCDGQAVAESNAPVAANILRELRRQVDQGRTDEDIEAFLIDRYGAEVVLTPSAGGVDGLVWVLPVVVLISSLAGLGLVFRRWSRRPAAEVSREDRELVEEYLRDG